MVPSASTTEFVELSASTTATFVLSAADETEQPVQSEIPVPDATKQPLSPEIPVPDKTDQPLPPVIPAPDATGQPSQPEMPVTGSEEMTSLPDAPIDSTPMESAVGIIVTSAGASLSAATEQFSKECPERVRDDCDPVEGDRWMCSTNIITSSTPIPTDPIIPDGIDNPDDPMSPVCESEGASLSAAKEAYKPCVQIFLA